MTRKIYLLLASLWLLLAACTYSGNPPEGEKVTQSGKNYAVKTIDGCEYLEYDSGTLEYRIYSLTHKGNCKNPIHQCGNK